MIKWLMLFVVFCGSLTGCGCQDKNGGLTGEQDRIRAQQAAIREVIRQDKAIGEEVGQKVGVVEQYWDSSPLVREIAARMDAIDLSGCPQDFQIAYKRHVFAWASMAQVKASNEGLNGFLKGFFTGGLAAIPAMSEVESAAKQIQATWLEVQETAIKHGVTP